MVKEVAGSPAIDSALLAQLLGGQQQLCRLNRACSSEAKAAAQAAQEALEAFRGRTPTSAPRASASPARARLVIEEWVADYLRPTVDISGRWPWERAVERLEPFQARLTSRRKGVIITEDSSARRPALCAPPGSPASMSAATSSASLLAKSSLLSEYINQGQVGYFPDVGQGTP